MAGISAMAPEAMLAYTVPVAARRQTQMPLLIVFRGGWRVAMLIAPGILARNYPLAAVVEK